MLSRKAKAAFYATAGPLMKLNGKIYRHLRAPQAGNVRVHLGPGQKKYIEGWINVDANIFSGRADVWADLRNPLPFRNNSVKAMYSHHVIEHLPDMEFHFREVFRCLEPGGIYRVAGPNGDSAIAKFVENDKDWFIDFPDKRTSIGGRFENYIFCRQEHLTILTQSFLEELLQDAGFTDLRSCKPVEESGDMDCFRDCLANERETDFEYPYTLVIEAKKPADAS